MRRLVPFSRSLQSFVENPGSPRRAASLIVVATIVAVVLGAVVMWIFDHSEYPNLGRALWFTLQTVTTVGYGDVTPESALGRVVAALVMLTAIGFITIVTAAITSTFVEAARRRADKASEKAEAESVDQTQVALTEMATRLAEIEDTLKTLVEQTRP